MIVHERSEPMPSRLPRPGGITRLAVEESETRSPAYVERDGVSLQHFVNRYIRTRHRSVNGENRRAVHEAIAEYRGHFPARCADLERFLDSMLLVDAPS